MILVSACLVGCRCRYNGKDALVQNLKDLYEQGFLFPICPELMGGLSIPRLPAKIDGLSGYDVLNNKSHVIDQSGKNVTSYFLTGAKKCTEIACSLKIKEAVLKSKSPSCGVSNTSTTRGIACAPGVTAAILFSIGVQIYDETSIVNRILYEV